MKKILLITSLYIISYYMSAQNQKISTDTILSNGTISVSEKAPTFNLPTQQSLVDLKGKKIALYFYPKDETPGCIQQACSLRDGYAELEKENWVILGISPDDEKSHEKFSAHHQLPFTIIPDTSHAISIRYGVWKEKNFMGKKYMGIKRTTFLINEEGIIEYIIQKVTVANHAQQILNVWNKK
ncbi:MAG: thioredoxin-dependent thiol peroxidase [Chitinophagaceae bacterium]